MAQTDDLRIRLQAEAQMLDQRLLREQKTVLAFLV